MVLQYSLGQCLVDSLPNWAFFGNFPFLVQKGKMSHGVKTPKLHQMVLGCVKKQFMSMFSRFPT